MIVRLNQIARPLTPIENSKNGEITLLCKLYHHGELGAELRKLKIGDEIDLRGPYGEFLYAQNEYVSVILDKL